MFRFPAATASSQAGKGKAGSRKGAAFQEATTRQAVAASFGDASNRFVRHDPFVALDALFRCSLFLKGALFHDGSLLLVFFDAEGGAVRRLPHRPEPNNRKESAEKETTNGHHLMPKRNSRSPRG